MGSDLHRFRCIFVQYVFVSSAVADAVFLLFVICCCRCVCLLLKFQVKFEANIQTFSKVFVLHFQIVLHAVKPVGLNGCSCSCAAGMALCNHVVALLFQTAHYSTMGMKTVPVPLSCTGVLQSWHRPRTQVSLSDASCVFKW